MKKSRGYSSLRANTIRLKHIVIMSEHGEANLSPKFIGEQLFGGWEVTKGNPLCVNSKTVRSVNRPAPSYLIKEISQRENIVGAERVNKFGLIGNTYDMIPNTSNKVR